MNHALFRARGWVVFAVFCVVVVALGYVAYRHEENLDRMPNVERAFVDSGDSADIAHIKEIVDDLLTDATLPGRIDNATSLEREETLRNVYTSETEIAETARIYSDGVVDVHAGGDSQSAYVHNEMRIKQFDGVRVTGDSAYVLFHGAQKYTMLDGSHTEDPISQYKIHLQRSNDTQYGWLITQQASSFVEVSGY
ncbi:hypothetical protein [Jonesia quinghaiensis]|uniref:hypothetical protein n=1 Tax=Jonesia quinghaiensis TaxID=262806 RepID=UPI0004159EE2|nr:hypothetical protein [Jonesia quinghaiensis]